MDNDVRLADLAIASNIMQEDLQRLIWKVGYSDGKHPRGISWQLMRVSKFTAIATRRGKPVTIANVAKALNMPQSTVERYLERLEKMGRVKRIDGRAYVHDLDRLDQLMSSRANINKAIGIVETCLTEWRRLLPLLDDQLK